MWMVENREALRAFTEKVGTQIPEYVEDPELKAQVETWDIVYALWDSWEWVERLRQKPAVAVYLVGFQKEDQFLPVREGDGELALLRIETQNAHGAHPQVEEEDLSEKVMEALSDGALLTLREIAERAKTDPQTLQDALERLTRTGRVVRERIAGEVFYSLPEEVEK